MSSVHSDHIYSVQAPSADQAEATSAVEAGVGAGAPGAKVQVQVSARKDLSGRIWSVSLAQVRELVASRSSEGTAFRANTCVLESCWRTVVIVVALLLLLCGLLTRW